MVVLKITDKYILQIYPTDISFCFHVKLNDEIVVEFLNTQSDVPYVHFQLPLVENLSVFRINVNMIEKLRNGNFLFDNDMLNTFLRLK